MLLLFLLFLFCVCMVYRSVKVKAIMREMKQLEESLPVHPDSAIFLRQVREREGDTHTHTHTHC